ncbi:MAG: hypothetical protein SNJ78_07665 [Spirochaetales bacterium]
MRSQDGLNWQLVAEHEPENSIITKGLEPYPDPSNEISANLSDVAYGNGIFVAVGSNGAIFTSSDGREWADAGMGEGPNLEIVTSLNNTFYATGGGNLWYSSNGTDWIIVEGISDDVAVSPTYRNGKYIVFAQSNGPIIYTGTNGISWTARSLPSEMANVAIYSVTFGSGYFVAVGYDFSYNNRPCIWISPDGETWSSLDLPLPSYAYLTDISYGNGFAIVGYDETSYTTPLILTSSNGISWNIQTFPPSGSFNSIYPCEPAGTFVIARGYNLYSGGGY